MRENTSNDLTKEAFCTLCKIFLRAHKGDLIKHSKTRSHVDKFKMHNPEQNKQATLEQHVIIKITDEEKERDITLATFIAMHTSIRSVDHLGEVLKRCGGKTNFENLRLHRTKCTALIKHVIGPSLVDVLKEKLVGNQFSLIIDESTDCSVFKYLSIYARFFDVSRAEVCSEFLSLLPVESVTAKELFKVVETFIVTDMGLSLKQILGVGTDGASNLCGKHNSFFTLLRENNPNVQLVRCICHSLDNAASKAVDQMPSAVEFLCREIYNWFSHSSLRRIQYRRLYDTLNDKKTFHNFVQLSSTRWLARFNAVNTIVEQWVELKTHFNMIQNIEKCYTARLLNEMLNDNDNILILTIIRPILFEVNKVNLTFQRNDVDIGVAYTDIERLINFLGSKIFKSQFVIMKNINVYIENLDNPLAYIEPRNADFGIEYQRALNSYPTTEIKKKILESKCFAYIQKLLKELIKRLPEHLNLFTKITKFSPNICLNQANRCKFSELPFLYLIPQNELFITENEYNLLITVNWVIVFGDDYVQNSLKFWPKLYFYKNAGGEYPFRNISRFVLQILSLPSSNAVVERGFSVMNTVKTKIRNKLGTDLLNSILRIRLSLYSQKKCCINLDITPMMLKRFKTDIMYNNNNKLIANNDDSNTEDNIFEIFDGLQYPYPCISL